LRACTHTFCEVVRSDFASRDRSTEVLVCHILVSSLVEWPSSDCLSVQPRGKFLPSSRSVADLGPTQSERDTSALSSRKVRRANRGTADPGVAGGALEVGRLIEKLVRQTSWTHIFSNHWSAFAPRLLPVAPERDSSKSQIRFHQPINADEKVPPTLESEEELLAFMPVLRGKKPATAVRIN